MAVDIYLTIPGIPGESTTPFRIPGSNTVPIEVQSFNSGLANIISNGSQSSGAGAGKVQFSEINIVKAFDIASPLLMLNCAKGTRLAAMTLSFVRAGASPEKTISAYLTYQLSDVFVASVSDSASSGGGNPEESVSFAFGLITVTYIPQLQNGLPGNPVKFGWNLERNSSL